MSTDGYQLHRAIVHSVDTRTGIVMVKIPAILSNDIVPINPEGLPIRNNELVLPSPEDILMVAVNPDLNIFRWVVGADSGEIWDFESSQDPTGLDGATSLTLSGRTVTIAPTGSHFDVWVSAVRYPKTSPQSITVPDVSGLYFCYFDANGTLVQSTTIWDLAITAPVATLHWHSGDAHGALGDERHGVVMDWATHKRLHAVEGTQIASGASISGYLVGTGGDTDANISYSLSPGVAYDEDILLNLPNLVDGGPYFIAWREGTAIWRWTNTNTVPILATGGGFIEYNQFTGGGWQRTALVNGEYMNMYVLATNFIDPATSRYVIIPGQSKYATLTDAQAESAITLDLAEFGSQELAAVWQITMRAGAAYGSTGKCRIEANPTRIVGSKLSVASSISPTSHAVLSHRSDPDQHPASSITYTPTPALPGIDMNTALNQLAGRRNLLHNGQMAVNQRGATILNLASGSRVADRWNLSNYGVGAISARYATMAAFGVYPPAGRPVPANVQYLFVDTPESAASVTASPDDYLQWAQNIEGVNLQHLNWGRADAKPLTYSFDCYAGSSFTAIIEMYRIEATPRVLSRLLVVPAGFSTQTVTFPGDSAGPVITNDQGARLQVGVAVAGGSTYTSGTLSTAWSNISTPDRWPGMSNTFASVASNVFALTNTQLEVGTVATPFEVRSYADELQDCMRYFWQTSTAGGLSAMGSVYGYSSAGSPFGQTCPLPVQMRAAPSAAVGGTFALGNCTGPFFQTNRDAVLSYVTVTATGFFQCYSNNSGYLTFSAEI